MPASEPAMPTRNRHRTHSVIVEPPIDQPYGRDRRQHTRHPMDRPAKLFCPYSGRFIAGRTRNISAGGVLVEIDASEQIESGEEVQMTIAFGDRFIVPMSELVPGSVIRSIRTDDTSVVQLAIAYDNAAESALSA